MKVLLVVKSKMMENLGVMYLSSVIKAGGHECRIVDLEYAFAEVINFGAQLVGFSIMTGDADKFKSLAKALRDVSGKFSSHEHKIIVGGPDPTFFPEGYEWADEIVRGEAELWAAGLTEGTQRAYTIDDIPWPDRTDFPNMKVRDFITSRGCPYKCSYCYNHQWAELFPDQKLRVRSVDDVVAEIKAVNPEYAYFQDSCFAVSLDWMREFAEKYGKAGYKGDDYLSDGIPIAPYQCNLRPEQVSNVMGELLRASGCVAVRMALESASNRLRGLIGRNSVNLRVVRNAMEILKEYEIQTMLQNILSLPGSTIEDDLFTLEANIKYQPTYAWASIYVPYPGTALGDYCKKTGIYKGNYENITDCFFDQSVLEFSEEYKEQSYCLQKIFALCVEVGVMPEISDLTVKNLPNFIHKAMRKVGDKRLYLGLL